MIEKYIILSLLYLEWFIQKLLCLPYKLYMKYDYWSHNRKVAAAAKYAEENPYKFPDND
tara:strand:- start:241 stop:417 length:177 start_codon:yes stop_codon:yes gene_type:complete